MIYVFPLFKFCSSTMPARITQMSVKMVNLVFKKLHESGTGVHTQIIHEEVLWRYKCLKITNLESLFDSEIMRWGVG